jgi:xylulokinase
MRQLILAHDLGTSGDKASLHDASGRVLGAHTEHYGVDYGAGGKAEQDADDWWRAFRASTQALMRETGTDPRQIACVVLSGQMMGAVLVGTDDRAVRPAMIWADTRAQEEARRLAAIVGAERGYRMLGHPIDPTCSLPKLMWLRAHDPVAWSQSTGLVLAKDYVTLHLTGRRVIDPSDASGTNAYDQLAGRWSSEMLQAAGIDVTVFPQILPSTAVAGGVRDEVAASCGLRSGTPVVVGGADGCTSALGVGLVHADATAVATIGTSAWIQVAADTPVRDSQRRLVTFDHVVPGHYVPLGAMQQAGAAVEWLAATVGATEAKARQALLARAAGVEAAAEGLFFLPYLMGERAPIWDAHVRAVFVGLSRHHGPAHLARAVLEGVAFNLYGTLQALGQTVRQIEAVEAVGGGARNDDWLRIMADIWGVPVRRRTIVDEANSLGAAVVGGTAVGLIDDWAAARALSSIDFEAVPDPVRHERAVADHERFVDTYERLRSWFQPQSG